MNNNDERDAFYLTESKTITSAEALNFTLRRPSGQVNLVATDLTSLPADFDFSNITVKVGFTEVPAGFNALTGEITEERTVIDPVSFSVPVDFPTAGETPADEARASFDYIFANVGTDYTLLNFTYEFQNNGTTISTGGYDNLRILQNYKTNLTGALLTDGVDITVNIDPILTDPDDTGEDPNPNPDPTPDPSGPQIGDFYYSDGTYSATLDESKTVIGLIFYLGDPAQDDAALKAEHPECTNGLVMSIIEHNDVWQANANVYMLAIDVYRQMMLSEYPSLLGGTTGWEEGSTLNEMLGYSHTYVMERYTANPSFSDKPIDIFTSLVAFRESNPAPAGTSDWYIPSAKEVFTFIVGEYDDNIVDYYVPDINANGRARLLNERLKQVSGADELKIDQSYFMYSSTEVSDDYSYGADQIYGVQSDSGMVLSKSKVAPALYRFVLAF